MDAQGRESKVRFHIEMPDVLYSELKELAKVEGRSAAEVMRRALTERLSRAEVGNDVPS